MCIPEPSWSPKVIAVTGHRIFSESDFDSSLGTSNASLGADAHARQGFFTKIGLSGQTLSVVYGRSVLESTISISTCESELTACAFCSRNVLGLHNVLAEVFPGAELQVPRLRGDNAAANLIAANQAGLRSHSHLSFAQIWVRTLSRSEKVKIYPVGTKNNSADLLMNMTSDQTTSHLLDF